MGNRAAPLYRTEMKPPYTPRQTDRPPTGKHPSGKHPSGKHTAGKHPAGSHTSGKPGADKRQAETHHAPEHPGTKRPAPSRAHTPDAPRAQLVTAPRAQPDAPQRSHRPRPESSSEPRASTPSGTIWIYGLHAVAAALANPQRRCRRLLLTEEAEQTLAERLPRPWSVPHERTDRARLDQMLGRDAVHQGMGLLADPLTPPPLSTILERSGPLLVLDQVTDPRNIGAILRSAAAFGVAGVIAQDRHAPEETGALAKAASGALEIVPLVHAVNLSRTLVALKAAGLWTVGLAADAPPLRGTAMAERRIALVLGAEGPGLRRLTRETCDELAGLAMPGIMESLNVSAAATVALYELTRPA